MDAWIQNRVSERGSARSLLWPRFGGTASFATASLGGVQKRPPSKMTYLYSAASESSAVDKEKMVPDRIYRLPKGRTKEFVVLHEGKLVTFGDPSMENHEDDKERRANFNARHNCSEKDDKTKAGYWACKVWDPETKVYALP